MLTPSSRRRVAATRKSGPSPVISDLPLGACTAGLRATVVRIGCPVPEARRLRTLGVFEGARIGVVGRQNGILLDVGGSRLALDLAVARTIVVRPLAP